MQINLIKFITFLAGLFLGINAVAANLNECNVNIKDNTDFVGTWILKSTSPSIGDGNKPTHELWQFKRNGGFELTAEDHRASATITSKSTYVVENNTLKIARIGRSGKYYVYHLCDKDDTKMVLFGGIEGFHNFIRN